MFVNPGAGDLHLVGYINGVVDVGEYWTDLLVDFDGDPRPYGPGTDYGADEVSY